MASGGSSSSQRSGEAVRKRTKAVGGVFKAIRRDSAWVDWLAIPG